MRRATISTIFMVAGCVLFLLSIFLGILSLHSILMRFVDSAIILEIHPVGGMSPRLYIVLLTALFLSSFISLILATLFTPKEPLKGSYWQDD